MQCAQRLPDNHFDEQPMASFPPHNPPFGTRGDMPQAEGDRPQSNAAHSENREMPYRILGRTGERVSAIGLGGWHIGFSALPEALSIKIIRSGIDRGINFLD